MPFVNLALFCSSDRAARFRPTSDTSVRPSWFCSSGLQRKGAAELGLVTRVLPDQELLATATKTARELAEKPPAALQACNHLWDGQRREQLERGHKARKWGVPCAPTLAKAKKAFTAFLEKRPAEFQTSERERKSKSSDGLKMKPRSSESISPAFAAARASRVIPTGPKKI
jgi:enoyl-CoA hydratase/carnithine racemase